VRILTVVLRTLAGWGELRCRDKRLTNARLRFTDPKRPGKRTTPSAVKNVMVCRAGYAGGAMQCQ
jgi:hypothetical protein